MQTNRENSENRIMHGIAVAVLSEDRERLTVLQTRLETTNLGRTNYVHLGFPMGPTDPVLRQIQDARSEIVLVDIDSRDPQRAINAIELIHATTSDISIFAVGEMNHPPTIVAAMRAGAGEFLDGSATREALLECLTRHAAARSKTRSTVGKAKVFSFLNAKGGAGATTLSVNTAIALQHAHGKVVVVDFAPIGHVALHLNLRPSFGVFDALQNLHRMDGALLEGFMTVHKDGLHLLAGPQQPQSVVPTPAELARLFDLLISHYNYVLVDCSSRLDQTTRLISDISNAVLLVTQTDVVSLWSAGRIHSFLEEGVGRDRLRLILNRYKRIPGFGEDDVEKATNCKVLWKVPNNYQAIGPAIDKGSPVALRSNEDASRSFIALANALAEASASSEGALDLVYQHDKSDAKKKSGGRLLISPLRAGQ
jgi:pilus assembly protein CpaE